MRSSIKPLLYGSQIGFETGEIEFGFHNLIQHDLAVWLTASRPLGALAKDLESHCHSMKTIDQKAIHTLSTILLQTTLNLMGESENPTLLTGEHLDEKEVCEMAAEKRFEMLASFLKFFKLQLAYIFGDYTLAGELAESSRDLGVKIAPGHQVVPRHYFYRGLTAVALAARGQQRRKNLGRATAILNTLKKWLGNGCSDCLHMAQLLGAEIAAVKGAHQEAEELYQAAIQSATKGGFVQDKALAHERAGLFYIVFDKGDVYWAAYHFDNAIQCYESWGATAKLRQFLRQHGESVSGSRHLSEISQDLIDKSRPCSWSHSSTGTKGE
jgi:tetratricopeptide (TPR) repeat protein